MTEIGLADRPVYAREDGVLCIININHWMIEKCNHQDKAGALGFLHAPPGLKPKCPSDVEANWRYYHEGGETVNPGIEINCASSPQSNQGKSVFHVFQTTKH